MPSARYSTLLRPNEDVLLTVHQTGIPNANEIASGPRYLAHFEANQFRGFFDPRTNQSYKSPSALCKAMLRRDGETNEWRGPHHCLVFRNGSWTPLSNL